MLNYGDLRIFHSEKFVTGTYGTSTRLRPAGDKAVLEGFLTYKGTVRDFCKEKLAELKKDCVDVSSLVVELEREKGLVKEAVVFIIIGEKKTNVIRRDKKKRVDEYLNQSHLDNTPAEIAEAVAELVPELNECLSE